MHILSKSYERRRLLSALDTVQLMLSFGMFTIALVTLVVALLSDDKRNNRPRLRTVIL
ncbi:type I toxin-antitoxin system toxin PepG1 [Enterococcus mundtii]|nr:type I toxin-antitoxin system toxin PepG1 [Enterococcus mundtii]